MGELKSYYHGRDGVDDDKDQCRVIFCEFANFFSNEIKNHIETIFKKNKNAFNVMAPVGGGYYIDPESSIDIKHFSPITYEIIIGKEYVGYLHLIENKCGIDNFSILLRS